MRRLRRALVLISLLSVALVPTDTAGAQDPLHDGEFEGIVTASNVVSPCPNPMQPTTHCRAPGSFEQAAFQLVARRAGEEGRRHELVCAINPVVGDVSVPFTGRQTLAEGRGFIGGGAHIPVPGVLFRDMNHDNFFGPDETSTVVCRVRVVNGYFHRVGTVAYGRITVDIHTTDDPGSDPFRHVYCGRFEASAIPTPPVGTVVTAVASGRVDGCTGPEKGQDPLHDLNRTVEDQTGHG
jgi:hypothetical protein